MADLPAEALAEVAEARSIKAAAAKVVVIDGVVAEQLSDTQRLPQQVFLGSVRDIPPQALGDNLVIPLPCITPLVKDPFQKGLVKKHHVLEQLSNLELLHCTQRRLLKHEVSWDF